MHTSRFSFRKGLMQARADLFNFDCIHLDLDGIQSVEISLFYLVNLVISFL